MLGVQDQRGVHGFFPRRRRFFAVQQVQEMATDGIIIGFDLDAPAVVGEVVPVQQHGAERRHQAVGDVACALDVVVVFFRQRAAEGRDAGAHQLDDVRHVPRGHAIDVIAPNQIYQHDA